MKQLLKDLHDSEINVQLSSFYDDGFTAKIGDVQNGFISEKNSNSIDEIEEWIKIEAIKLFPESKFTKNNSKCKCGKWHGLNMSGNCFECGNPKD